MVRAQPRAIKYVLQREHWKTFNENRGPRFAMPFVDVRILRAGARAANAHTGTRAQETTDLGRRLDLFGCDA